MTQLDEYITIQEFFAWFRSYTGTAIEDDDIITILKNYEALKEKLDDMG
jgi:hypothetical protein